MQDVPSQIEAVLEPQRQPGGISGTRVIMRDSGLTVEARSAEGYLSSVNPLRSRTAAPSPVSCWEIRSQNVWINQIDLEICWCTENGSVEEQSINMYDHWANAHELWNVNQEAAEFLKLLWMHKWTWVFIIASDYAFSRREGVHVCECMTERWKSL